jgi:hypothetical protein
MTTPDSRQSVLRKIARTTLAVLNTVLPMSAVVFERKQARYWQALPVRSMAGVLVALFFTVGAWGFFQDLVGWRRLPFWALLVSASLFGLTGVVSFVIVRRRVFKLIPVLIILGVAAGYVPDWLPRGPHIVLSEAAHQRIALDAICIMVATMLGYWSFLFFINNQGLEQVRTRAELDIAYRMQQMLVPPIAHSTEFFEAYGLSLPSEEVGGDLVDMISTESGWVACLADVSGHGIQASLLMGNLRTALRYGFAQGQSLPDVISAVCRVLPEVKPPEMYATFAGLLFKGGGRVEYLIAGHPAILQYHATTKKAERRGMEQFPLGLAGDCVYDSTIASYDPGDLFVLLSDGVIETEDSHGGEFGFERVERVLIESGAQPLKEIMSLLMGELEKFGNRTDDQTVLLIRATA